MQSSLFHESNLEISGQNRFALQNSQMLRVALGPDVLAAKGAMVAYQGRSPSTTKVPAASASS